MAERRAALAPLPRCRVQPAVLDRLARLGAAMSLERCDLIRLVIDAGLVVVERDQNNNGNGEQQL